MNAAHVREAGIEDLPALARLWEKLDAFHRQLGLAFPEVSGGGEQWAASFERTLGRFSFAWVAEKDGQVAAFLTARVKQSPAFLGGVQVGEISDLYVGEGLRGEGVGGQLVDAVMRKFEELAVHSVEVQVLEGNAEGLDFWLKRGFGRDLTLVRKLVKG